MRSPVCVPEPVASGGVKLHLAGDGGIPSAFYAEATIVACGAHSAALTRTVGQGCPLDTERGHSITFSAGTEGLLKRPVCDPARGFIASPMAGGLRAAGTVELGGMHAGLTAARCEFLERSTAALLAPEISHGLGRRLESLDWLGFRPTMPDALPVIGRAAAHPGIVYAFGHQHVGWTLGGITGLLVAELVNGATPSIDLSPYALSRFRAW